MTEPVEVANPIRPTGAPAIPNPRRRLIFRAAGLLVGLLFGAALAELAIRARLAYVFRGRLDRLSREAPRDPSAKLTLGDFIYPVDDPSLIYRMKPGARGLFQGAPIEINSAGFRDAEVAPEKPPGSIRILALGDSNSFGWGVHVEQGYLKVLEASLRRLLGSSHPIDVINTSTPGYNAVMESELFEKTGVGLRPDLVLIQYSYNDHTLPSFIADRAPYRRLDRLYLLHLRGVLDGSLFAAERDRAELHEPHAPYQWSPDAPGTMRPEDVPPIYRHHLGDAAVESAYRRLRDACRRLGVPLLVVLPAELLYEWNPDQKSDPHYDRIRAICARLEIPVVDTFPTTRRFALDHGLKATDLTVGGDLDWHPNPLRHALMTRALLAPVLDPLRLPGVTSDLIALELRRLDETLGTPRHF